MKLKSSTQHLSMKYTHKRLARLEWENWVILFRYLLTFLTMRTFPTVTRILDRHQVTLGTSSFSDFSTEAEIVKKMFQRIRIREFLTLVKTIFFMKIICFQITFNLTLLTNKAGEDQIKYQLCWSSQKETFTFVRLFFVVRFFCQIFRRSVNVTFDGFVVLVDFQLLFDQSGFDQSIRSQTPVQVLIWKYNNILTQKIIKRTLTFFVAKNIIL